MRTRRALILVAAAAGMLLFSRGRALGERQTITLAAAPAAIEEKTLLTPDGTLYDLRAGNAVDLGVQDPAVNPDDNVIQWTFRKQDGTTGSGVVPGTAAHDVKRNLDLAYDEQSATLVLLWKEELWILNVLHLATFKNGIWNQSDLLPNVGFPHAYNPQMLLSRQTVKTQDSSGNTVSTTRSILSVIWWEEAQYSQARYAPIFLDEDTSSQDVQVYDLPSLIGNGPSSNAAGHPAAAYMSPALRLEGPAGGILASFADLNANKQYVTHISYPDDLGKPGPGNITWLRRRIPVVGVASEGPIAEDVPIVQSAVTTVIGQSYNPTLVWRGDNAVGYTHFDGKRWTSAKTIPLSDTMTYERAMQLIEDMATKN